MKLSYLARLMLQIASGAETMLDDGVRATLAFVRGCRGRDGGFVGRRGASDLYYTSFGLRTLALFGETSEESTAFVEEHAIVRPLRESVDVLAAATCASILTATTGRAVLASDLAAWTWNALAAWRLPEGGIQTSPEASSWSTYQTFWATAILASLNSEWNGPTISISDLSSRHRDDGGFVELAPLRRSGTNPTAAAVGLWSILTERDESARSRPLWRDAAVRFLRDQQTREGGFRPHARIGVGDLLSTFTAIVALDELDALTACDLDAARHFASSCRRADGGFAGGVWDTASDVEYTFYGLATEAFLRERG